MDVSNLDCIGKMNLYYSCKNMNDNYDYLCLITCIFKSKINLNHSSLQRNIVHVVNYVSKVLKQQNGLGVSQ